MAREKATIRRLVWTLIITAVGVYLYGNLEMIEIDLNESGYVLSGDLETGFMRNHTETGKFSICWHDSGQIANGIRWRN